MTTHTHTTDCADRFRTLIHPQEVVLQEDLAALRKVPAHRRLDRYETLLDHEETFVWGFSGECPDFLTADERDQVRSKFRLARLLVAASFHAEGEVPAAIAGDFVEAELQAAVDFDRYKTFDALTEEQIEKKVQRMEGEVYELVTEYATTQIHDMDAMLDDPEIQRDVMRQLVALYEERLAKIEAAFVLYVRIHSPSGTVESIERAIGAVTDATEERVAIREELQADFDALSETLEREYRDRQASVEATLRHLEAKLSDRSAVPERLQAEVDDVRETVAALASANDAAVRDLSEQLERTAAVGDRLDRKIADLQRAREESRDGLGSEARTLIDNELEALGEYRQSVDDDLERLRRERERIEADHERLDARQADLEARVSTVETSFETADHVAGDRDGGDLVTTAIARLFELDYLGRVDITMHETPTVHTPAGPFAVPEHYWDRRSEHRSEVGRLTRVLGFDVDPERYPANRSIRYDVTAPARLGFSRRTVMAIEVLVSSHLEAFATNGFDARPADLDDLLSVVNPVVYEADREDHPYLLAVASPTGWTDDVRERIRDEAFARTRFSRHVSVCLVDLRDGTVYYDEADEVARENARLFEHPVDAERVRDCVTTVRERYLDDVGVSNVRLSDLVEQGFDPHVVKRAFDRLEREGVGDQLYVDEYGLCLAFER